MFKLNYIGSKYTLIPFLDKVLSEYIPEGGVFGDLFSGTGIVSYSVGKKYNCKVVANDIQYYSFVMNKASLSKYSKSDKKEIERLVNLLNNLKGKEGFITKNYSEPTRLFFTRENGMKIDAIREYLKEKLDNLKENIYFYLLASLVASSDKVANTSCVYGSYLKKLKPSALKTLKLENLTENSINIDSEVKNFDILSLTEDKFDIVYLDPPYNGRQYCTNYHLLETIARGDEPEIYGKIGLRPYESEKSTFCSKVKATKSLEELLSNLNSKVIIMSYSDEGIIKVDDIKKIMKGLGKLKTVKQVYKKFKARKDVERKEVYEYLFILEKEL